MLIFQGVLVKYITLFQFAVYVQQLGLDSDEHPIRWTSNAAIKTAPGSTSFP